MGFVKGDYEKRICKLRGPWGDVCNRGYQYIYYVSEQGKSYLNWMDNIKPEEDSERSVLMDRIAECLTLNVKKAIFAYYMCHLSKAPRRYRGPSRRDMFLSDLAIKVSVFNCAPAPLELENQRLEEENQKLARGRKESDNAAKESSRDCDSRIEEMERKHNAREKESDAELERRRVTIDTLSREQRVLGHATTEWAKMNAASKNFLFAELHKYAPEEEYVQIQGLVNDLEKVALNRIMEEVERAG